MKTRLLALTIALFCRSLYAGPSAQEFVDKYRTAFEKGDKATLESFLYTEDAHPMALEFYKKMHAEGAGTKKIAKIELLDVTPEDLAKASELQTAPDGSKARLPLTPTKKLKITIGKTWSERFVAEKDGKYVIPVPATVK